MGFFSDLKEDLSQAVNNRMQEETLRTESAMEQETVPEEVPVTDIAGEDAASAVVMSEYVLCTEEEESTEDGEAQKSPALKEAMDEVSVIAAGMTIDGDVTVEGSLEMKGTVNGNVDVHGRLGITGVLNGNLKATQLDTDNARITGEIVCEGTVRIGLNSVVIGNIFSKSAVIAGAIKGDVDVQGPVTLEASAIVMGNIRSKAVQINNGAVIEGMCSQCYADVNPMTFFDEYKKN